MVKVYYQGSNRPLQGISGFKKTPMIGGGGGGDDDGELKQSK